MSKPKRRVPKTPAPENRVGEAMTVAWMLTVIATLMAELVAVGSGIAIAIIGTDHSPKGLLVLPSVMWIIAIITGILDLVVGAVVHRIRSTPAPKPVLIFAAIIGVLPILALLVLLW